VAEVLGPSAAEEGKLDVMAVSAQRDRKSANAATSPLTKGSTLAPRYEVVAHLSRGDVTDVYDVWSEERDCRCVAKCLRPEFADQRRRARLVREGRLLERFSHPHIVRAYEVLHSPEPILILETLTGETLAHLIARRQRRLPLYEVAVLGLHLCSAIGYLHRQGLLHLDLNPSNIVAECGRAKVLDLSIAQPPGQGRPGVGTRRYMPPEQARGGDLGPAADVWGIGEVLYEAASGQAPFRSLAGSRYDQLERVADPVSAHRRVPTEFAQLVFRCLGADSALRPSVAELAEVLGSLVGGDKDARP
jgi:eukaryotic-like serine/threonine-protein kinase